MKFSKTVIYVQSNVAFGALFFYFKSTNSTTTLCADSFNVMPDSISPNLNWHSDMMLLGATHRTANGRSIEHVAPVVNVTHITSEIELIHWPVTCCSYQRHNVIHINCRRM